MQLYGARKSCKNRAEVNALMHNELNISKGVARTTAQFFSIYKAPPRRNFYKKFCTFLFRLLAPEYEEISIFVLSISVLCAMMIIYLTLPKYLGEWCLHDWGDANGVVRFPRGSAENDVLEMQLDKLPEGAEPQLREDGQIAIEIPDFKSKPAPYWCVLSEYARKVLTHVIMVRFRVQLWNDLYKVEKLSLPITDCIYDWMERHGIEPEEKSWEAIRQMFFRQRKAYREGQTPPKR